MELTEYVSARSWERFNDTEKVLSSITPKQLIDAAAKLFAEETLTIGYFIGSK